MRLPSRLWRLELDALRGPGLGDKPRTDPRPLVAGEVARRAAEDIREVLAGDMPLAPVLGDGEIPRVAPEMGRMGDIPRVALGIGRMGDIPRVPGRGEDARDTPRRGGVVVMAPMVSKLRLLV